MIEILIKVFDSSEGGFDVEYWQRSTGVDDATETELVMGEAIRAGATQGLERMLANQGGGTIVEREATGSGPGS